MRRINIKKILNKIRNVFHFKKSFAEFNRLAKEHGFPLAKWSEIYPILGENTKETSFDSHYIYHPAWAMQVIKIINPIKHTDISSILSFSANLSAFVPTEFYDYRPANLKLKNLKVGHADLTSLPFPDNSIESLSCMHTIEHVGLGRYGDEIDPNGDKKAALELKRVLKKDGNLIVVVPVGNPTIKFNAHRIYSFEQVLEMFSGLTLIDHMLVPDNAIENGIIERPKESLINSQIYGCGCFWFKNK